MDDSIEREKAVKRWYEGALREREAAREIAQGNQYRWSLFLFHLALEKLLKAILYDRKEKIIPTHDLRRLVELAEIEVSPQYIGWLDEVTRFNMEARYEEEKFAFHKKATREYTKKWLGKCEEIFLWLEQMIKS